MSKLVKTVVLIVIGCFLYSGMVWAGGIPSQTLGQDTGRILTEIFSQTSPQRVESGFRQFLQIEEIDKGLIFSQLVDAISKNIGNSELLEVYKNILFVIFANELKSINQKKTKIFSASKEQTVIKVGKKYYTLSYRDNELSVVKRNSGPSGAGKSGTVLSSILPWILTGLIFLRLIPSCKAQDRKPPVGKGAPVSKQRKSPLPKAFTKGYKKSPPKTISVSAEVQKVVKGFDKWLSVISKTRTGLPPSHVGDTRPVAVKHGFATGGFTYDLAQVALRYVRTGVFHRARHIVLYFAERFNEYTVEELKAKKNKNNVYGILRLLPSPSDGKWRKHIINCIDTSSPWNEGNGIIEWYSDGGPQSWLGMAAVQLLMFDKGLNAKQRAELEKFVSELADTIMGLFHSENVVSAGPKLQDIEGAPKREHLGHIENMWDHYAFLMQLADYFESQNKYPNLVKKCREKAKNILLGLKKKRALVKKGDIAYFWQGFKYGRINSQIPTDVQTWGIASVGPKKLNEVFGSGTAEGMLNWLIKHALVLTDYTRPDGYLVTTIGADFSDPYLQDIKSQRGGVKPQITDEWTAEVIYAMDVMANYYYEKGEKQKAEEILAIADALRWFGLLRATKINGMLYWQYSTEPNMPTGYGWNTPDASGGSLAGNQMLFALLGINPYDPSGSSLSSIPKIRRLGVKKGIELLLRGMDKEYRFSKNTVNKPRDKIKKVKKSCVPWVAKKAKGKGLSLTEPSIFRKTSFYSAIGENRGRVHASREMVGVRTVASWNCAEISFSKYLDLSKTPYLTLRVKASRGVKALRINVVDKHYLLAKDWTRPPAFVQVEIPGDNKWHTITVDLSESGADMQNIGAISFEVGTNTTGNPKGTEIYIKGYRFVPGKAGVKPSGEVDKSLVEELGGKKPKAKKNTPTDEEGVDQSLIDELAGKKPQAKKPVAKRSVSTAKGTVICSGWCPQSWGGIAYFKDGNWKVSDNDYFEVKVEGSGEYILRLVGRSQSYDQPDMYSEPLKMGKTYKIYFRDLKGWKEYTVKQIGINQQSHPWGNQSEGGKAEKIYIKLVIGGHSQVITPDTIRFADGTERGYAEAVLDSIGQAFYYYQIDKSLEERDKDILGILESLPISYLECLSRMLNSERWIHRIHPWISIGELKELVKRELAYREAQENPEYAGLLVSAKSWTGNEVADLAWIAREVSKSLAGEMKIRGSLLSSNIRDRVGFMLPTGRGFVYEMPSEDFIWKGEKDGVSYEVVHSLDKNYFTIRETRGDKTVEKKVFAMPLVRRQGERVIIVPKKLYERIHTNLRYWIPGQLELHESFEGFSPENRLEFANLVYNEILKTEEDKDYFLSLWRKMGINVKLEDGRIVELEPLTENAAKYIGHIGAEIMELVDQYINGKESIGYEKLSDVTISSLDAFLLGLRLKEILDIDIDADDFERELITPGDTKQIILGMAADGRINLELVADALEAVQEVSGEVSTLGTDYTTKATLILSDRWSWQQKQMGELKDTLGDGVYRELMEGLKSNGYEYFLGDIQDLLLHIRNEIGRTTQIEEGRIRLTSPYIHTVIARIAQMANLQPQILLEVYYNDLLEVKETGNILNRVKSALVESAVENALVEVGVINKRGLLEYESQVNSELADKVIKLAMNVYRKAVIDTTAFVNTKDLAIGVDKSIDPFGIIEDLLLTAPYEGKIRCAKTDEEGTIISSGQMELIDLLNLQREIERTTYTIPEDLEVQKRLDTLVINLDHLFTIKSVDLKTGSLVLQPKALGIAEKVRQVLTSGGKVKIVGNPKGLESILDSIPEGKGQAAIQEAVEKYLGLQTSQFSGLTIEVKEINEVINGLENPQASVLILTHEDTQRLQSNRGAFIYIPQPAELLGDAITVAASVGLTSEGKFTDQSKQILLHYLQKQIPGISRNTQIWQEIQESIENFDNRTVLFFKLPDAVKFTERLKDLGLYRLAILIAA